MISCDSCEKPAAELYDVGVLVCISCLVEERTAKTQYQLARERTESRLELDREARQQLLQRATAIAKKYLVPGDRLRVTRCGGAIVTVTFDHWDRDTICSKSLDDIHAAHVISVNGKIVNFARR